VERWSTADIAVRHIRRIAGVVEVVDHQTYDRDDRDYTGPGLAFGIA
jgi:hypothetical protein